MKNKVFILSVDGGGLKGLIAVKILEIIEGIMGSKIFETFHLLAGTSTGGLIVSALSVKDSVGKPLYDLSHIETIYLEVGERIFKGGGLSLTGKETEQFHAILTDAFGQKTLKDTLVPIFVPTYDTYDQKIVVFKTRAAQTDDSKNIRLVDVCRATSAIPPVFPTYPLIYNNRKLTCIDGGYYLKNPSVAALAEVWKHQTYYGHNTLKEEEIVLLSISTGNASNHKKDWTDNMMDVLEPGSKAMQYIREQKLIIDFPKINYRRVDLNLGSGSFSVMNIIEWQNKLKALSDNKAFRDDMRAFLNR